MIKSQDKTSVPDHRHSSCFAEHDAASGIAFEKSDSTKRLAPYSFLANVDFDGANTLIFRYTCGTITVQGEALEPLWNALCRGTLARVTEQAGTRPAEEATSIRSIIIEDYEGAPNGPRFPEEFRER